MHQLKIVSILSALLGIKYASTQASAHCFCFSGHQVCINSIWCPLFLIVRAPSMQQLKIVSIVSAFQGIQYTSAQQILGLDELFDHSAVTTIICFIIYKEWLLLSLENRKRKSVIALDFFKNEINLCLQIYEKCVCIDSIHIDRMKELVLHL